MVTTSNSSAYYVTGMSDLITREINETGTDFIGDAKLWSGAVEAEITFTKTVTKFAADNNPNYAVVAGPTTGQGTIKLFGVKNSEFKDILPVQYSQDKGVRISGIAPMKFFAASFIQKCSDSSSNKIIMYKIAIMDDMPIVSTTINGDGVEIKDFTFNVEVYQVPYVKEGGETGSVVYDIINNRDNTQRWSENDGTIMLPYDLEG